MISKATLEQRLHTRDRKMQFEALAKTLFVERFPLTDLVDLSFNSNSEVAFRAAWLLELTFIIAPEAYVKDIAYIINRFPEIKNDSCRRHFTKILISVTKPKTPAVIKEQLRQIDWEPIVETLFDWMIEPDCKIAVKAFAIELLLQLSSGYPWIKDELKDQVVFLMRDGSSGIQARGRKILRALQKEKHLQKD